MTIKLIDNSSKDITIIIKGSLQADDHQDLKKFYDSIDKYTANNLLLVDFEDAPFNKIDLSDKIKPFIHSYEKVNLIVAVHGAQVFPNGLHYSTVGKTINIFNNKKLNSIVEFFTSNTIKSSDLLESIGVAAGNKPLNVWQYTCQGSKLLDSAIQYLPQNSIYVAEGDGFLDTSHFLKAFTETLFQNEPIEINDLFMNYLQASANSLWMSYQQCLDNADYNNSSDEFCQYLITLNDPLKVTIGQEAIKAVTKADNLVNEIRTNKFDTQLFASIVNKIDIFNDSTRVVEVFKNAPEEFSFANCISSLNKESWLFYQIYHLFYNDSIEKCLSDYAYKDLLSTGDNLNTLEKMSLIAEHYYNDFL